MAAEVEQTRIPPKQTATKARNDTYAVSLPIEI
jgi:hypothetical protein